MAATIRIKSEKHEAEEDRDEYEQNLNSQTLFTDFLQQKIDELKELALAEGVERHRVMAIVGRQCRSL